MRIIGVPERGVLPDRGSSTAGGEESLLQCLLRQMYGGGLVLGLLYEEGNGRLRFVVCLVGFPRRCGKQATDYVVIGITAHIGHI